MKIPYSLYVGIYPVTYEEYEIFTKDTNYKQPDFKGCEGWDQSGRPVVGVNWNDAVTYVQWLSKKVSKSYRLLSEAEWEYCCRAGTETDYSFGSVINPEMANYDYRKGQTTRVNAYKPNKFGLYDMHGNVWEWVQGVWHG